MLQLCSPFHRAKLTEPSKCPITRESGCHILGCNSKPATTENLDYLQLTSLTGKKCIFFDWNQIVQWATAEHQVMAMRSRDQPKVFQPGQNIYFSPSNWHRAGPMHLKLDLLETNPGLLLWWTNIFRIPDVHFCIDPSWCRRKAGLWKLNFALIYMSVNLQ